MSQGEVFKNPNVELHRSEALRYLETLDSESVDAVITDPPYSSGGRTSSARAQPPAKKYVHTGTKRFANDDFFGDNRDQLSQLRWSSMWLTEAYRVTRPGGYCLVFSDWRQLSMAINALQMGGWIWRGVIAWNKGRAARAPHKGYFRHQCEFIVWGSRGTLAAAKHGGPWDGMLSHPVLQKDKHHMVGKPTPLMRELVQIVPPGGLVLDPFAGSGTTLVAAAMEERRAIGCEITPQHFNVAVDRLGALAA